MGSTVTTTDQHNQLKMELAEAVVDASRSLERTKRRVELLLDALDKMPKDASVNLDQNIQRCRLGISELVALNNDVRRMNT